MAAAAGWVVAYPARYYNEKIYNTLLFGRHPRVDICPECICVRQQESSVRYQAFIEEINREYLLNTTLPVPAVDLLSAIPITLTLQ
jgi:hypothetical protein